MIQRIYTIYPDIKLILVAPYHYYNQAMIDKYQASNELVDDFNTIISAVAKETGDYYVDTRGVLDASTDFVVNEIHSNESGMSKITDTVENAVRDVRGSAGLEGINLNLDYDHYIIKINAYDEINSDISYRFRLTNKRTGEVIYNTSWQKDNCFWLDEVDSSATYTMHAETDNNGDRRADFSEDKTVFELVGK